MESDLTSRSTCCFAKWQKNMVMDEPVRSPALHPLGVNLRSPAEAKIALLRSLFHGREDVYLNGL
jgi:hypothetical protein